MLSPKTFNNLNRKLHSKFNAAKKAVIDLKLDDTAWVSILETLDSQYLQQVKALHDMEEPKDAVSSLNNGTDHVHVEMPK